MRWIFRIVMALVLACVVLVGLVFLLPAEKIGNIASAQLEKATGRTLTLSGTFSPSLYPTLGLKTGPLTISNADWAGDAPMIEASSASIGVGLAALWGGDIQIKTVVFGDPIIRLERHADGRVNWDFGQSSESTSQGSTKSFSIDQGQIVNGRILFKDDQSGKRYDVNAINANIVLPADLRNVSVVGSAVMDQKEISFDAQVNDVSGLNSNGSSDVAISAGFGGLKGSAKGQLGFVGGQPSYDGTYSVVLNDLVELEMITGPMPEQIRDLKAVNASGSLRLIDTTLVADGSASMRLNGEPLSVQFSTKGLENWQQDLRFALNAKANSDGVLAADFDGRVNANNQSAVGLIDLNVANITKAAKMLGAGPVALPKGAGNTARVQGNFSFGGQSMTLKNASIRAAGNTVTGLIKGDFKGKPYFSASLAGDKLDVSAFTSDEKTTSRASGTGWSKDAISLSGMDAVNADISLKANSVNIGVTQLGRVNVDANLRGGVLSTALNEVQAFSGVMTGTVALSGRGGVSMDSNVRANDMRLEQLLGSIIDFKRLTGKGDARLKLSGTGGSLHALMNSLSGDGSLDIANGAILGIDLAAMMRNLKKAFGGFEGVTEFTSLTGTFSMSKGVLTNTDMTLASPLFKALGTGRVDIGGQAMNYRVTPSSMSEDAKFSVPVDITGPWNNLRFKPDLAAIVSLLGDDALGNKVSEEVNRVQDLLKDPEGAIKDKVETKLKDELFSRLGLPTAEPEPAPVVVESTSAAAISTSPTPRGRPNDLNTNQVVALEPVVTEEPTAAKPKPLPTTKEEVREVVKEKVEEEVKDLLKGLFGN